MNWQNLKSKVVLFCTGITNGLNHFLGSLSQPLKLFRFFVLLFVLDFIAFMALTKSSYLQLLNPLAFLWVAESEGRTTMELYFPRSLSLTGLEKMYPEDDIPANAKTGAAAIKGGEKPLDDAAVRAEAILILKRVAKPRTQLAGREVTDAEATARRVIYELMAGPAGELETLKARNLLKEPLFLRALWTYEGKLYISTEKVVWEKMTQNERKITEYCIVESLKKNLPTTSFALLKE